MIRHPRTYTLTERGHAAAAVPHALFEQGYTIVCWLPVDPKRSPLAWAGPGSQQTNLDGAA